MRRGVAFALLLVMAFQSLALAVGSKKAEYVGGTQEKVIPAKTECTINTENDSELVFVAGTGGGKIEVPYATVGTLEYGQKVSHRIKTAILVTPWSLFSKKRRHYLSLTWKDRDSTEQAAVWEIGKEALRPTVLVLEARSGKKLTFQDEEAQKHFAK